MQHIVSRKIFGQLISYSLAIEENQPYKQYHIRVKCLQPKLFQQMLSNSPELFRKQLLQVATHAAHDVNPRAHMDGPAIVVSSKQEVAMRARFSFS